MVGSVRSAEHDRKQAMRRTSSDHTKNRMHYLEQCKRLRPFCELAYAIIDVSKANERYKKYDAAKYSRPEYGADKIIAN